MKTQKMAFFSIALVLLLVSCSSSTRFIHKLTHFVEQVEQNHSTYTENNEWESVDAQFFSYVRQYRELNDQDSFSIEENEQVVELLKRYIEAKYNDWSISAIAGDVDFVVAFLDASGIKIDPCVLIMEWAGFKGVNLKELMGEDFCDGFY